MTAIEIAWLSVLTLLASWLGFMAVLRMVLRFLRLRGIGPSDVGLRVRATRAVALLLHVAGAIVLTVYVSLGGAIIVISGAALVWGCFSYFLLQRFSRQCDRVILVRNSPNLLPLASLASFVSASLAFLVYTRWYFACVPLVVWFVLGFVTAEIAIRSFMEDQKGTEKEGDRRFAVFAVNRMQGRNMFSSNRYPFP